MLIIERRAGESIRIGDEVQLCVLDTDGTSVRIGVSAPRDLDVQAIDESDDSVRQAGRSSDTPGGSDGL